MPKVVGESTFWIVDAPASDSVADQFRNLVPAPVETPNGSGSSFYFKHFGPLEFGENGEVAAQLSPLVSVSSPGIVRNSVWTCAEIHFLNIGSAPIGKEIAPIKKQFKSWLSSQHVVFDRERTLKEDFSYYLCGSILNFADRVFATDAGIAALRNGQFIVDHASNDAVLDTLCKRMRLLGIDCS